MTLKKPGTVVPSGKIKLAPGVARKIHFPYQMWRYSLFKEKHFKNITPVAQADVAV